MATSEEDAWAFEAAIAAAGGLAPLVVLLSAETTGAQEQAPYWMVQVWQLQEEARRRAEELRSAEEDRLFWRNLGKTAKGRHMLRGLRCASGIGGGCSHEPGGGCCRNCSAGTDCGGPSAGQKGRGGLTAADPSSNNFGPGGGCCRSCFACTDGGGRSLGPTGRCGLTATDPGSSSLGPGGCCRSCFAGTDGGGPSLGPTGRCGLTATNPSPNLGPGGGGCCRNCFAGTDGGGPSLGPTGRCGFTASHTGSNLGPGGGGRCRNCFAGTDCRGPSLGLTDRCGLTATDPGSKLAAGGGRCGLTATDPGSNNLGPGGCCRNCFAGTDCGGPSLGPKGCCGLTATDPSSNLGAGGGGRRRDCFAGADGGDPGQGPRGRRGLTATDPGSNVGPGGGFDAADPGSNLGQGGGCCRNCFAGTDCGGPCLGWKGRCCITATHPGCNLAPGGGWCPNCLASTDPEGPSLGSTGHTQSTGPGGRGSGGAGSAGRLGSWQEAGEGIAHEFCCRRCLESCSLAEVREIDAYSYCALCQEAREPTKRPTCGHNMCRGCYETCIVALGVVHSPKDVGIRVAILGPQNSGKTTLFNNMRGRHADGKPIMSVDTVGVGKVKLPRYEGMLADAMHHPDIRGEADAIIVTVSMLDCTFNLELQIIARRLHDWFPNLDEMQVIVVGTKPDRADEADRAKFHEVAREVLGMTPKYPNVLIVRRDDVQPLVEAIGALPRATPLRFERDWVRGVADLSYRLAVLD